MAIWRSSNRSDVSIELILINPPPQVFQANMLVALCNADPEYLHVRPDLIATCFYSLGTVLIVCVFYSDSCLLLALLVRSRVANKRRDGN